MNRNLQQEAMKKQAQVRAEYKKKMEAEERARTEKKKIKDGSLVCVADKLKEDLKQVDATISTGFKSLDNELGGGLRTGSLIILGGIPSLGKTTLALNIANNVAKTGRDVLFFSLEMSRVELVLKSISRQTFMPDNSEHQIDSSYMKTIPEKASLVIDVYGKKWTETQKEEWQKAVDIYREKVASHLHVAECSEDVEATMIREEIDNFTLKEPLLNPLVIVDYIQIMTSSKPTDKQSVDANMTELKRIARDYKVAIIAISSFSRSNYYEEVGYESFKESGGIDYGADVMLGLQLIIDWGEVKRAKELSEKRKLYDDAKSAYPRKLELKVIKNRISKSGGKVSFDYYSQYDFFGEVKGL
jgi:replicative DNA helicase